ncbi:putative hydrolase [Mycoplasmopsis californica]|uniref:Ribonuclease J n=1 Tax=Mycoplasmopsis equigenitalium TaxID=114883 RepID=A0ABY5J2E3_9BACT|nr:ribonuclease J [Mycoplasmopsis equigenitalium]UUD37170.1 ribonuclease J [Mycoplasmopsis equigenitalium]VEU69524.1 putative hydrolase [Mycoplasmopsis californica]
MAHIKISSLGGVDENGKNSYLIDIDNDLFVINAGAKIPVNSKNGIDTVIPDYTYLVKNHKRIKGIFITDTKNDSFSSLPWLLMDIKKVDIYSSPFNCLIIKNRIEKYKIGHADYTINKITKPVKIGKVLVKPIPLAGSMPGLNGFDFETEDGHIIFMFNYVNANLGVYGETNLENIKKYIGTKKVLALVLDSGKANITGYGRDKIKLPAQVAKVFEKARDNQRIIVGAYDEEMYSISEILDLAIKYKRPVITYGKSYGQLIYLISKINKEQEFPTFIDYKEANKTENAVILVTSTVERLYQRFLRIADKKDVYLRLKRSDNVIMLAPPINGIESLAAYTLDEVARISPKLTDIPDSEFHLHRPYEKDILDTVNVLNPTYVIPVMGLYRYMIVTQNKIVENTKLKHNNVLISQNGKIHHFINGVLSSSKGKIPDIGDAIIDGFGIGDVSTEVIKEREVIGQNGVIAIALLFSNATKEIVGDININYYGVISKSQKKTIDEFIKSIIIQTLTEETFLGIKEAQERIRRIVRKKIFKITDKEPMVVVTFYGA